MFREGGSTRPTSMKKKWAEMKKGRGTHHCAGGTRPSGNCSCWGGGWGGKRRPSGREKTSPPTEKKPARFSCGTAKKKRGRGKHLLHPGGGGKKKSASPGVLKERKKLGGRKGFCVTREKKRPSQPREEKKNTPNSQHCRGKKKRKKELRQGGDGKISGG